MRHFIRTADSSSPVTSKTESSNPSTQDVQSSSLESQVNKNQRSKAQFFKRLVEILDQEHIEADKKVVLELINKHFPDWRRVLNECQRHSVSGKIDSSILANFSEVNIDDLMKNLKKGNFPEVRKWVVNNLDNDSAVLMKRVYDTLLKSLKDPSIADAVLIISKYQYQIAFI